MAYLGQVSPFAAGVIGDYLARTTLDWWEEQKVKRLVPDFPKIFDQAVTDWAKLKTGVKAGAFTAKQIDDALAWFRDFPQLWETIRVNFIKTPAGLKWGGTVDDFIGRIKKDPFYRSGQLGIAPVIVAGVLIVGGVAASLWAIQYIQRQANLSEMIDGVIAGKIPPEVLAKAIEAEKSAGLFSGISDTVKWLAIAGGVLLLLPMVLKKK